MDEDGRREECGRGWTPRDADARRWARGTAAAANNLPTHKPGRKRKLAPASRLIFRGGDETAAPFRPRCTLGLEVPRDCTALPA